MTPSNPDDVMAIECQNLSKQYDSKMIFRHKWVCALENVSFRVPQGQTIGLVGPNGAGKTTLIALIAGLLRPTQGVVRVCGHAGRTIEARRCLRYMPEAPTFLDRYTGHQTLAYHAALAGVPRQNIDSEIQRLSTLLDLGDVTARTTVTYSQGMKQRLGLAVALLGAPRVLLLDEPSNGLDPAGVIRLRTVLQEEAAKGTTILISSHRLAELEKLTSHFIFLKKGTVVPAPDATTDKPGQRVRIKFLPGGPSLNGLLRNWNIVESSDTHLLIHIEGQCEIPPIIRVLTAEGMSIVGVASEREDIEDTFMRLYNEKG